MSRVVMDASAILALLNQEAGFSLVEKHMTNAIISSVNLSEVVTVLIDIGSPINEIKRNLLPLFEEIVPFSENQAIIAAELRKPTKQHGLSLGDRACLALAQMQNIPVITADKTWQKIKFPFEVITIR